MTCLDPRRARQIIVEQSKRAHVGHIGCSLSVADILCWLYSGVMAVEAPDAPERDRFVMSKGHAALALYAALHLRGWLTEAQLDTYCGDASLLGVHPERDLAGVDFATGSLGQGLSYAVGAALAARMQGSSRRVFALLSDAECNEGSTWEAVMFAAHHRLANLLAIIDLNGQQAFGYTREVLDLPGMCERWRTFGWHVEEVDGHDIHQMTRACERLRTASPSAPQVLIARTVFGRGVSFMERRIKWHYWPMSEQEYRDALNEIATAA